MMMTTMTEIMMTTVTEMMMMTTMMMIKKGGAMEDEYRTKPTFKLQGSYRDMNKLVAKVVPIINDKELEKLLLSHYESESQTTTSSTETDLLNQKDLIKRLDETEQERRKTIQKTFVKTIS